MAGARFWVRKASGPESVTLSEQLLAACRQAELLSPAAALAAPKASLPEVVVIPVADAGHAVTRLLTAWSDVPSHVVFWASPVQSAISGVTDLGAIPLEGLLALLDAVTERDRLARESAFQAAWNESLLRAFPGLVIAYDAQYRVLWANARVAKRIGRNPVGERCYTILHGRSEPCPWCPRDRASTEESVCLEVQSPLDGLYFQTVVMPVQLPGQPSRSLVFCLDVTDRKLATNRLATMGRDLERRVTERTERLSRQTQALSEANARLLELDALKSDFLATVTHDLRTPLTSVLGFAKLTRRDFVKEFMPFSDVSEHLAKKGARIADNLRIIENEGARLTRLVNDFLDLSKIESGRLDWHDRLITPDEIVHMAVDAVSGEYEQNEKLVLVVDVGAALPPLLVDPDRLTQVLVNLLTNAARHAREGDVLLSVRRLSKARMEFRVADDGPGIPEGELERIFDKFHQVCRGDTKETEPRGTGLGLAICKQIVERYDGTIRAERRQPQGTVFVVELPVPKGPAAPDAGSDAASLRPASVLS